MNPDPRDTTDQPRVTVVDPVHIDGAMDHSITADQVNAQRGGGSMNRRSFLGRAGGGAAAAIVIADGLLSYRAYGQGVLSEGQGPAFDAWHDWEEYAGTTALVAAAVLAANAHNTQPWRFVATANRVDIFADLTRNTGANDPLNRELYVSLGCALENIVVAAPAKGFVPTVSLGAIDRPTTEAVASVALAPGVVDRTDMSRAIAKRRSNRSEYTDRAVSAETRAEMTALADASVAPARLVWLSGDQQRTTFGVLLVEATRAYAADDQQSRDSFAWWRYSWEQIQKHKDGLNIDGVGLSPLVRTLGKILPKTSRKDADATFIKLTKTQTRTAAAYGVVMVDDPGSMTDRLNGGRLLERLHLWATIHDLGFQYMNQLTERIDRDAALGGANTFDPLLAGVVGPGALAAFRVGTPTVAAIRSPRRPVDEVMK